jgi:hypothetical protein
MHAGVYQRRRLEPGSHSLPVSAYLAVDVLSISPLSTKVPNAVGASFILHLLVRCRKRNEPKHETTMKHCRRTYHHHGGGMH